MSNLSPAPAIVVGNNWKQIKPIGDDFIPTSNVSVIVPYYQSKHELDLVLASLLRQTYPVNLMEIIVVDDGSDPPLSETDVPEGVRVVRQERDGFGVARARNLGAEVANGEILVFVDGDMVLCRNNIESHAMWHHNASNIMTFGTVRFIHPDNIKIEDIPFWKLLIFHILIGPHTLIAMIYRIIPWAIGCTGIEVDAILAS